ncbi:unnamed protein product [Brassica oleracea var. botrytis]
MELMRRMCKMLNKMSNWINLFQKPKTTMETIQMMCITTHKPFHYSPLRSPIGPSKRSKRKQARVAPYESCRGKDVALSREKNILRRRKSFEKEINDQFKEMMELRHSQGYTGYDLHGNFSGERFKALQRCHGDPS